MFPCMYDPAQHEVIEPEVLRWCRRMAPAEDKDRLFCYRHKLYDTFVIAHWVKGKYGLFLDFFNMGTSLGNFKKAHANEFLRRKYAPTSAVEMSRTLSQNERDMNSQKRDDNEELRDIAEQRKKMFN